MDLNIHIAVKTIGLIILLSASLGLFGVSLKTRLRVGLTMMLGVGLCGFPGWKFIRPASAISAVTFFNGDISLTDAVLCVVLAFAVGFTAYFVSYPKGRAIAPIALPAAMAFWAFMSSDMASLIKANYTAQMRQSLYDSLKWESFFWLGLALAGLLGTWIASIIKPSPHDLFWEKKKTASPAGKALSLIIALVLCVVVPRLGVSIFAQDVKMFDAKLTTVIGQPGPAQIAFAVIMSFAITAFCLKKLLGMNYLLPMLFTAVVSFLNLGHYSDLALTNYMVNNWSPEFFPRSAAAVLPIQMVSFGIAGAILGYHAALMYNKWQHENTTQHLQQD